MSNSFAVEAKTVVDNNVEVVYTMVVFVAGYKVAEDDVADSNWGIASATSQ